MSRLNRGDVVLVEYPFSSGTGSKRRPALVVQDDGLNARISNTILAQITTNLGRAGLPTQVLIDVSTAEGRLSGLRFDSLVNCTVLLTVEQSKIRARIGTLSAALMAQVDAGLKAALHL